MSYLSLATDLDEYYDISSSKERALGKGCIPQSFTCGYGVLWGEGVGGGFGGWVEGEGFGENGDIYGDGTGVNCPTLRG
jgi:hypothetical protein